MIAVAVVKGTPDEGQDGAVRHLRLTHPSLDSWIDVRVLALNGPWLTVADLAGEPDVGLGSTPTEALRRALCALPDILCADLVTDAERQLSEPRPVS